VPNVVFEFFVFKIAFPNATILSNCDFICQLLSFLLTVADLPGLIPGSHRNRGLGIAFLKHAERCAALLFILDLAASEPWTHLEVLQFELSQFSPELVQRPQLVVANKLDLPEAKVIPCTCNTIEAK
jgi:GTPase involved in cell partitioning and DNA repair